MSRFLIPLETLPGETRVSATPETVRKFLGLGCHVSIEEGAGTSAGFLDQSYLDSGAEIIPVGDDFAWGNADVVLSVSGVKADFLRKLKKGSLLVGLLSPYGNKNLVKEIQSLNLSAIALELLPRISRAQSSDALSSQANIAGYKAVLLGASALDRYFPMLMTAAGTVQPSKIVVLGAGVAGLQAIATAKRLGAVVFVSDIRPEVQEQVESLGARFIAPPESEALAESGGYATQVSSDFLIAQRKELTKQLSEADVAICTAQVPGKKAPQLITEEMLDKMRPGSVVVDIAVTQGGNCFGTIPSETVVRKGVKLIGASDLPCTVPNHASALYSRNLLSLISPMMKEGQLSLNLDDELIDSSLISKDGVLRHESLLNIGGKV